MKDGGGIENEPLLRPKDNFQYVWGEDKGDKKIKVPGEDVEKAETSV